MAPARVTGATQSHSVLPPLMSRILPIFLGGMMIPRKKNKTKKNTSSAVSVSKQFHPGLVCEPIARRVHLIQNDAAI